MTALEQAREALQGARKHLPVAAASWHENAHESPGYAKNVDKVLDIIKRVDAALAAIDAALSAPQAVTEKGVWTAQHEQHDARRVYIESSDFTHDVRLYVNGDFEGEAQKLAYAREMANRLNAALSAQEVPAGEWVMVPREPTPEMLAAILEPIKWAGGKDAYRAMLIAAPAAPKQAEAHGLLPERLMRFLLRDLKTERADLAGFLSLNNEVRRAAEYDEWIAAVESYCQQYAPAAPQD